MKSKVPNLTSNFESHKNIGDNFLLHIQVGIYLTYIPTKYKENWRTLLIPHPIPPQPIPYHQTRPSRSLCKSFMDPGGSGKGLVGKGSGTVRDTYFLKWGYFPTIYSLQGPELCHFLCNFFSTFMPELCHFLWHFYATFFLPCSDAFMGKNVQIKVAQKWHKKWHKRWHKNWHKNWHNSGPWSEMKQLHF